MRKIVLFFVLVIHLSIYSQRSIREFGVLPENNAETNKENLQKAINWASQNGSGLYVEPVKNGYTVATGIVLKKNVSLIGVHGPTGRGTKNEDTNQPTGSLFKITDDNEPFMTVESATQLRGIQFWYPEQTNSDPTKIIEYKPTIQVSKDDNVYGVTLSNLTFYGEYMAMDFASTGKNVNELLLFEHCYGYPLSGEFIRIDYCYDIPRILHCHVNPANMREFGRTFNKEIIDHVVSKETYSYFINHTDNAQMMDIFTFGVFGGVYLGAESYGQLTNFNLDCVTVGIYKNGSQTKNRNWQIAQGSIIANTGKKLEDIHPIIIEGEGHTSITNVEAFSGGNGALTTLDQSYDYLLIKGNKKLTVSLFGCRMRNYVSNNPFSIENQNAKIQAVACIDKYENFYNYSIIDPKTLQINETKLP